MDNKKRNIFFLYFKGLKIAYSLDKKLFWMQIANSLGNVIIGYLSTIIAAIVINGVVEGKDKKELFLLAIIVVFANFASSFCTSTRSPKCSKTSIDI